MSGFSGATLATAGQPTIVPTEQNTELDSDGLYARIKSSLWSAFADIKQHPFLLHAPLLSMCAMDIIVQPMATVLTGNPLNFTRVFPSLVRDLFNCVGITAGLVAHITALECEDFRDIVTTPIIEGLTDLLPLLIVSKKIDGCSSTFITPPLLGNRFNVTGGHILKCTLAVISSLGFMYGHGTNLDPAHAEDLFAIGLALSYLTLRNPSSGIALSMLAHGCQNLTAVLGEHFGPQIALTPLIATTAYYYLTP